MSLKSEIPLPTLKRYSIYLSYIRRSGDTGWVSTSRISEEVDVKAITVRKDLNYLGIKGIPQKGFPRNELVNSLKKVLGGESCKDLVLVGTRGLGSVYRDQPELILDDYKLRVCFDDITAEDKSGVIPLYPLNRLPDLIPRLGITVALLSVEPENVQNMAEKLYSYGIKGILNLTTEKIKPGAGQYEIRFNPADTLSRLLGLISSTDLV